MQKSHAKQMLIDAKLIWDAKMMQNKDAKSNKDAKVMQNIDANSRC